MVDQRFLRNCRIFCGLLGLGTLSVSCGLDSTEFQLSSAVSGLQKCVGKDFVQGVDVSEWQENVDWAAVARQGYQFAYVRVSYGTEIKDAYFQKNWIGSKRAGLLRGAYQYFLPDADVQQQVDIMLSALGKMEPGDLPPVIDVEETGGLSPDRLEQKIALWVNQIREKTGLEPIIYTGAYFWRDEVASAAFLRSPLWLAHYTDVANGVCAGDPSPWPRFHFWQWTDKGRVNGIQGNVDLNAFRGTLAELKALAVPSLTNRFCPDPYAWDKNSNLCVNDQNALGPFPKRMQDTCIAQGGGTKECQSDRWNKELATALRGSGLCPLGTQWDSRMKVCHDTTHAYGPFDKEAVQRCVKFQGGQACYSMRYKLSFFQS